MSRTQPNSGTYLLSFGWVLTALVSLCAVMAWGMDYDWQLSSMDAYYVFPLLGLLAFSTMWAQYVTGFAARVFTINDKSLLSYFRYTGYAVLVYICLHPGLLIAQRFADGYGLPPGSYKSYVDASLQWVVFLGVASLLVFLLYELRRVFGTRTWWRYVNVLVDIAMLAVFYHGLTLGGQLSQNNWFRTLWVFYGVILIAILAHKYATTFSKHRLGH